MRNVIIAKVEAILFVTSFKEQYFLVFRIDGKRCRSLLSKKKEMVELKTDRKGNDENIEQKKV